MTKYLWVTLCVVSCSVAAPKKEATQSSESHLYKLNFKNAASEIKTALLSLGVPVEKASEAEGKGEIVTQRTSTKGVHYPLQQRLLIEYRYENPDYTWVKVTLDLQTQTPWEATLTPSLSDQIEQRKKELSRLEEKRSKLEILELDYQKEKEKLENQLKELEQKRKEEIFDIKAEENLSFVFLTKLDEKFEIYDPQKSLAQKEVIRKIFSLAEKIYEKRDDTSTRPKDVLDKKELFYTIWKLAEENRKLIPKMIHALEDKDPKTRLKAAIALWAIGREPMTLDMIKEARQALKKKLKDSDSQVREYSEKALKRLMGD
ncbi:MAG: HEAT repeat domain-containing protein [Deltaproteobacteria bacterium]|nr:HEAT repeat domain-containing protein [Deltaproteobacteria bacterium]